jgi:hypothetical protein
MKTTEQLIQLGEEYFNKCGKHLFVRKAPNGTDKNYMYVCLLKVNNISYRVKILFGNGEDEINGDINIRFIPMTSYPTERSEYSDTYFPGWYKYSAVKQHKKVKEFIQDILDDTIDSIKEEQLKKSGS